MTRRKILLILLLVGFVTTVLFTFFGGYNEPTYEGITLTTWLNIWVDEINSTRAERDKAGEAIKSIGTNGIPVFIKLFAYDRDLDKLNQIDQALPLKLRPSFIRERTNRKQGLSAAVEVFLEDLGPSAKSAIPALVKIVNRGRIISGGSAIDLLKKLGPEGQNAVYQVAMQTNHPLWWTVKDYTNIPAR